MTLLVLVVAGSFSVSKEAARAAEPLCAGRPWARDGRAAYDALITKYATVTVAGAVGALLMKMVNFPLPAEAFFT